MWEINEGEKMLRVLWNFMFIHAQEENNMMGKGFD